MYVCMYVYAHAHTHINTHKHICTRTHAPPQTHLIPPQTHTRNKHPRSRAPTQHTGTSSASLAPSAQHWHTFSSTGIPSAHNTVHLAQQKTNLDSPLEHLSILHNTWLTVNIEAHGISFPPRGQDEIRRRCDWSVWLATISFLWQSSGCPSARCFGKTTEQD